MAATCDLDKRERFYFSFRVALHLCILAHLLTATFVLLPASRSTFAGLIDAVDKNRDRVEHTYPYTCEDPWSCSENMCKRWSYFDDYPPGINLTWYLLIRPSFKGSSATVCTPSVEESWSDSSFVVLFVSAMMSGAFMVLHVAWYVAALVVGRVDCFAKTILIVSFLASKSSLMIALASFMVVIVRTALPNAMLYVMPSTLWIALLFVESLWGTIFTKLPAKEENTTEDYQLYASKQ